MVPVVVPVVMMAPLVAVVVVPEVRRALGGRRVGERGLHRRRQPDLQHRGVHALGAQADPPARPTEMPSPCGCAGRSKLGPTGSSPGKV